MARPVERDGTWGLFLVHRTRLGYAAHIPDAEDWPLCGIRIKRTLWVIKRCLISATIICRNCRQRQAKLA